MKVKLASVIVILILFSALHSQHINLVSESMPSLGLVENFCKYGDYGLFIRGSHHLAIVDFDEPSGIPVAVFDIPENYSKSYDVLCYGSYAYLFVHDSMFIISLQDILHPILVNEIDLAATRAGCVIQGNILYIATSLGSLSSYQLNNPELPIIMDTVGINSFYSGYMFAGEGFIACQGDSIRIVDISDPFNIRQCATLDYADNQPGYSHSPAATMGKYLVCSDLNELKVYNLTNLNSPSLISSTILDCTNLFYTHINDSVLWSVYYEGTDEYSETGIMAIDLSNPFSPVISLRQSLLENWDLFNSSMFMRASGNRMVFFYPYEPPEFQTAVLSGSSYTLSDIKFHDYSIGRIVANSEWIAGINPVINVLDYRDDNSLYTVKLITPESYSADVMQLKDELLLCAYQYSINEDGEYAYVPALDIYNLQTGIKLSSFPLPLVNQRGDFPTQPYNIEIYNNHALLSNGLGGLVCIDITDPANPSQRFWLRDPYYSVNNTAVRGNELWLGTYVNMLGGYLRCYDISVFNNPTLKYQISLGDISPGEMLVIGDYLYVKYYTYLRCYLLGPESVIEQNDYHLNGMDPAYILPLGKGLLLGGDQFMRVLSLKDPLHPVETGYQELEKVNSPYPWEPPYYPNAYYAINNYNILVGNGHYLKCFDATLAAVMCQADLDLETQTLQVFPNPGRGQVYIGFNAATTGSATLEIYNLRGQNVINKSFNSTMEGLNLQNIILNDNSGHKLAAGIYFVKVKSGSKTQTSKLVVLH